MHTQSPRTQHPAAQQYTQQDHLSHRESGEAMSYMKVLSLY